MKKSFVVGFVLAGTLLPAAGQAQALIDLTRVTCADYLAMSPAASKVFSAWMNGWLNHKVGEGARGEFGSREDVCAYSLSSTIESRMATTTSSRARASPDFRRPTPQDHGQSGFDPG